MNMIKHLIRRFAKATHRHQWAEDESRLRRRCITCGKWSYVMEKKYPQIGEPKYTWSED